MLFNRSSGTRLPLPYLLFILFAFLLVVAQVSAQTVEGDAGKRVGVRLRSFVPEAIGSIYFEPTTDGGVVRLTALGLPVAEELARDAHAYLVWAVTNGESPLRVGELRLDGGGNGGLEFARPPAFRRYAIVVTAEPGPAVEHPNGVMVFASRAGAVEAQYGEKVSQRQAGSQGKSLEKELRKSSATSPNDFYAEVEKALNSSPNGGRFVELVGAEVAPKARGAARLATHNENLYLRTLIKKLPPVSSVGATSYVLWGIAPRGRITYMGSLPSTDGGDADAYVRVAGVNADEIDLLVSAETRRPVSSPSGRRALASRDELAAAEETPDFGAVEGQVLDEEGQPVAGAVVEVRPSSDTVINDNLPVAYTDERGIFFLDGLKPGEHVLYASKEDEGYPSVYEVLFISDVNSLPKANVQNRQVTRGITVRLGHKAARLKAHVVNALTDKPVEIAEVTLYRDDKADSFFSFGLSEKGEIYRQVPSMPLKMKVVAPGYGEWHYGVDGTEQKAETLPLEPDKTRELTIRLQPLK